MEFGNKQSFSVEYDLDENYGGVWLYGRFCYWINGDQVGDYNLGTSLRDLLFQMKFIVSDCGNRDGRLLCKLSSEEVFSLLDTSIYGSLDPEGDVGFQLPDIPARFEIKIPVDVFDQWKVYLLECGNRAIMLYKKVDAAGVSAASIPTGLFDSVIKEAYDSLNDLYDKETLKLKSSPSGGF
jgi:hypothetical protein